MVTVLEHHNFFSDIGSNIFLEIKSDPFPRE